MAITIDGTNGLTTDNAALKLDGTTLVVDDTNDRVGVNDSSPEAKLDVYIGTGLTTFGDFSDSLRVQGGNNTGKYVPITFGGYGSYAPASIAYLVTTGTGNTKGDLVFGTRDVTTDTRPTEAMRIDSSGNLKFNSGYGSAATAYGCRAWVNFNGTGTVAIRDSGNVSSISDQGSGLYQVNFSTAMPDDDFATTALANYVAGSGIGTTVFLDNTPSTTSTSQIVTVALNTNYGNRDCSDISVAVFR
jgi:hypothetical protein